MLFLLLLTLLPSCQKLYYSHNILFHLLWFFVIEFHDDLGLICPTYKFKIYWTTSSLETSNISHSMFSVIFYYGYPLALSRSKSTVLLDRRSTTKSNHCILGWIYYSFRKESRWMEIDYNPSCTHCCFKFIDDHILIEFRNLELLIPFTI